MSLMKGATALFSCMCIAVLIGTSLSPSDSSAALGVPVVERPLAQRESAPAPQVASDGSSNVEWLTAATLGFVRDAQPNVLPASPAPERRPVAESRPVRRRAEPQSELAFAAAARWAGPQSERTSAPAGRRAYLSVLAASSAKTRALLRDAAAYALSEGEGPETAACRTEGSPQKADYVPNSAAISALMQAGASLQDAKILVAFADRETSGWTDYDESGAYDQPEEVLDGHVDPLAYNDTNTDNSIDYGAWQINDHAWRDTFQEDWDNICNLAVNARIALAIYEKAGTSPWCLPVYLNSDDPSKRARATGCPDGPPAVWRTAEVPPAEAAAPPAEIPPVL